MKKYIIKTINTKHLEYYMNNLRSIQSQRSFVDRRSDQDRRKYYDIQVVDKMGFDRRKSCSERRKNPELRVGWIRVSQWSSACIAALTTIQ